MTNARMAVVIGILTFISLLFYTPHNESSQVITRMGLTLSIVEEGKLTIDRVAEDTVDKSLVNGHYYADKAPGQSLLGVIPVGIVKIGRNLFGVPGDSTDEAIFAFYAQVGTLVVVALPAAIAAAVAFLLAIRFGASQRGALVGTLAVALGSPFFYWSTTYFAHSLVGSLLIFILALAIEPRRWEWGRGIAIGLLVGLTVTVEFVGGFALLVAGVVLLVTSWRPNNPAHLRFAAGVVVGSAIGILPLFVYNYLAFGSPFMLGYMTVVGFEGMKSGFFGIGLPNPAIILELLIGGYRGLLPLAPILILVPYGISIMWQRPENRPAVNVIVAVSLVLILINSGYYYWHGGFSTGPRHLMPMLPLLGLALSFAWPAGAWTRFGAFLLLVYGLVLTAVIAAQWIFASEFIRWPLLIIYLMEATNWKVWLNVTLMLPGWIAFAVLYYRAKTTPEPLVAN